MQQYRQGFLPTAFNRIWITNQERIYQDDEDEAANVQHILSSHDRLYTPSTHLTTSTKHPLYNLPKTWIEFPNDNIKVMSNRNEFNFALKCHLLDSLNDTVECNRLLCPVCHLNKSQSKPTNYNNSAQ